MILDGSENHRPRKMSDIQTAEGTNGALAGSVTSPPEQPGLTLEIAFDLLEFSVPCLWSGSGTHIVGYLMSRGLTETTIRSSLLGLIGPSHLPLAGGRMLTVEGIVIPWIADNKLVLLKLRQPRQPKYVELYRDRGHLPLIYPGTEVIKADLPVVIVEGELEALLLGQELVGIASVITLGSASSHPRLDPRFCLNGPERWYAAMDADPAGEGSAETWMKAYPRARRARPPAKDWTEARQMGIDLRGWWQKFISSDTAAAPPASAPAAPAPPTPVQAVIPAAAPVIIPQVVVPAAEPQTWVPVPVPVVEPPPALPFAAPKTEECIGTMIAVPQEALVTAEIPAAVPEVQEPAPAPFREPQAAIPAVAPEVPAVVCRARAPRRKPLRLPEGPEIWSITSQSRFRGRRQGQESAWEPVVLCALGLRSGFRFRFWSRHRALPEFFHARAADVFVAHGVVTVMKYLLRLRISLPMHWFDTLVAWRYRTNAPEIIEVTLAEAMKGLGLAYPDDSLKSCVKKGLEGKASNLNDPTLRQQIQDVCFIDCAAVGDVYKHLVVDTPQQFLADAVEYAKAIAVMGLRGIRYDIEAYKRLLAHQEEVRAWLMENVNQVYEIYKNGSFSGKALLTWCKENRIEWPTKPSENSRKPRPAFDRETFEYMRDRNKFLDAVCVAEEVRTTYRRYDLTVDPGWCYFDTEVSGVAGRHYFNTGVFGSVTGGNQPAAFVFNAPRHHRLMIISEGSDHVLVYVDYVAQAVGVAAALSGDANMRAMYEAPDCHMAFAIKAGAAPEGATKETHAEIRKRYKVANLGVLNGETSIGMAKDLRISKREAERLITDHRNLFQVFWEWSDRGVQEAISQGFITTPRGWRARILADADGRINERTWRSFPMQGAGSDIMRETVIAMHREKLQILAPVPDGVLIRAKKSDLEAVKQTIDRACRAAVERVLGDFPLRWEITVHDSRFEDEEGKRLYDRLRKLAAHDTKPPWQTRRATSR